MTLAEVAAVVGGRLADATGSETVTGPATLDSRDVASGGLFVAIAGERVDGHDFAAGAVAAGAAGVLGSRPVGAPAVLVGDPVDALGRLARHVRDVLAEGSAGGQGLVVLALTGSQGKTGTKDYLAGLLAHTGAGSDGGTVATRGNLNNELGVPLTVLRATPATRYLVVEMGARGVGHIGLLCRIARPDVAAVLNVGSAHLGEFGSIEAIAQAKGEIVESLAPDGTAVLAADDHRVAAMRPRTAARVVTFGGPGADVVGELRAVDGRGRAQMRLAHAGESTEMLLPLPGRHQVANATAAAAMGLAAGLGFGEVAEGLAAARPDSRWRMEVTERGDGLLVLNDAYNANPASVVSALVTLVDMTATESGARRRSVAVLGEMKELGDSTYDAHVEVGRAAVREGVDVVVVVDGTPGGAAAGIADGAETASGPASDSASGPGSGSASDSTSGSGSGSASVVEHTPVVVRTAGRDEAVAWVGQNVAADDVVLVKASRGVALEHVAYSLMEGDPA
ncbi:UDP-N-acetylmuramoyl-tripeptide--D-alanyl-D-alanine ligase [Nocardioides sp. CFH 31398]|uniref:UDP-N-acetylmuramoyl-tripeptide--D-alanyl-D- alanine ligase n=1 Tax=Nocardioides sp. CFH 31398 TaxID=2919579 RepID=UPI001F065D40|nr:UDP-N-acetylmuramoyl-tripeptide--D-alanyl-D-alanine ligase [Nocardioides sp. CFH 31398]MCH1868275.1 UDP-N-acetylmuramoyl-tripeptide--D-alanyl-D-alanine ligase [Nocardioides sp. CFH 31398]